MESKEIENNKIENYDLSLESIAKIATSGTEVAIIPQETRNNIYDVIAKMSLDDCNKLEALICGGTTSMLEIDHKSPIATTVITSIFNRKKWLFVELAAETETEPIELEDLMKKIFIFPYYFKTVAIQLEQEAKRFNKDQPDHFRHKAVLHYLSAKAYWAAAEGRWDQ